MRKDIFSTITSSLLSLEEFLQLLESLWWYDIEDLSKKQIETIQERIVSNIPANKHELSHIPARVSVSVRGIGSLMRIAGQHPEMQESVTEAVIRVIELAPTINWRADGTEEIFVLGLDVFTELERQLALIVKGREPINGRLFWVARLFSYAVQEGERSPEQEKVLRKSRELLLGILYEYGDEEARRMEMYLGIMDNLRESASVEFLELGARLEIPMWTGGPEVAARGSELVPGPALDGLLAKDKVLFDSLGPLLSLLQNPSLPRESLWQIYVKAVMRQKEGQVASFGGHRAEIAHFALRAESPEAITGVVRATVQPVGGSDGYRITVNPSDSWLDTLVKACRKIWGPGEPVLWHHRKNRDILEEWVRKARTRNLKVAAS